MSSSSLVSWVQCNRCDKWRIVDSTNMMDEEAAWFCEMNPNPLYDSCSKPEEEVDEVKSPKRYIPSAKTQPTVYLDPQQPASKRAKTLTADQEFLLTIKSWSDEQLREYWESIDWGKILELQKPHEPSLPEFKDWIEIDDDDFVVELDAKMRANMSPRLSKQVPKLTSLRQEQEKLRRMIEQEERQREEQQG
jgi:hypothetical protein